MHRLVALSLPLAIAACALQSEPPTPATPAGPPPESFAAGYDDRDCNLQTPLQPGIPGSPGNLIPSPRNPNGASELSALMRVMVNDLNQARTKLERGEPPPQLLDGHRRMRCVWQTRPEDRNERYDAMAVSYLHLVRAYDRAPGKATYNSVVAGCVACHTATCEGVLEFIDGMIWR